MQHVVASGDTPWSLAVKFTGSGNRWPELCAANPQLPKHASYGCVFKLGGAINIPATWTGGTTAQLPETPSTPTSSITSSLPAVASVQQVMASKVYGVPVGWIAIAGGLAAIGVGYAVYSTAEKLTPNRRRRNRRKS